MRSIIPFLLGAHVLGCFAAGDAPAVVDVIDDGGTPPASVVTPAVSPAPRVANADCAAVRAVAERALPVRVVDDTAAAFEAPRDLGRWSGCRYHGAFALTSDSVPANMLDAALAREAWQRLPRWDADGADGSEFGVMRGDTFCHVALATPDPGDEQGVAGGDAPRAIPLDYDLDIRCTTPVPSLPS